MRPLLGLLLCSNFLYAEFEVKGYVGMDAQGYISKPDGKHPTNFTLQQQLELSYNVGDFESAATIYAQEDSYDLTDAKNERTFIRLDELYGQYNFENDMIFGGRNIRFWGALEANNVVDTFNTTDFRTDGLDTQKQGAWNVAYTHYTESGEISLIVKLYEEKEQMAAYPYVYYFFPEGVDYDENLQSTENLYRPTLYLNWNGSTESEYPIDYAFIVQHGFDNQRAFNGTPDFTTGVITLNEEVYLVNKAMSYNTMVVGSTLLKLEAQVIDVIDDNVTSIDLRVADYYQFGMGVEHTLTGVVGDADLGLIGEYYYYNTFNRGDDIADDLALFQVFQNDLFLGLRYTFNDASDSSIIAGAIIDLEYEEQSYSVKYETRFFDVLSMKADYAYIKPSTSEFTAYRLMGTNTDGSVVAHQRVGINLAYHF
jgi:hypothetical protein